MDTEREVVERYEEESLEIDLRELILLFWRKKWLIISFVMIALVLSFFISDSMLKIYQSSTMVMIKDSGVDSIFAGQYSFVSGDSSKNARYKTMMKSRMILDKVIEKIGLYNEEGELIKAKTLGELISISDTASNDLLTITVQYPDPVKARDIVNTLVEVFIEENKKINSTDLDSAVLFISNQVEEVKNELDQVEEELLAYKVDNEMMYPSEYGKILLDRLTKLETAREETGLSLEETRVALVETRKQYEKEEEEIISAKVISNNPIITSNKQRLVELEIELSGLLEVYTEKHPKVIETEQKIEKIKEVLASTVEEMISSRTEVLNPVYQGLKQKISTLETNIITAEARLRSLEKSLRDQEEELKNLPVVELELLRLERERSVAENIYLILMERREEIQIQQSMESSDIVVLDLAIINEIPIRPRKMMNMAVAVVLAAFLGVLIVFLQYYFDTTVKEEEDVKRLTGLSVIGIIPDMSKVNHNLGYGVDR